MQCAARAPVLAGLSLTLPTEAQLVSPTVSTTTQSAGPARASDPLVRLVGVPVGLDATQYAASVGATFEAGFGPGNLALSVGGPGQVARFRWLSASEATTGSSLLLQSGAAFVERDVVVQPPESSGCGEIGPVGSEQCTAAFFDGTPTQGEYGGQAALPAIAFDQAPAVFPGRTTVVAVIDSGVDPLHPELLGGIAGPGYDFLLERPGGYDVENGIDDDGDGIVDEGFGHGTHVAGLIRLIDPAALILPYRVLDSEGNGTAYDVAQAIYLAGEQGANVINLSLGLRTASASIEEALESAVDEDDVIAVTSAGNSARAFVGPLGASEETVTIAAVDDMGIVASFASTGANVDAVAPGVSLYSAMPGNAYAWWSGSSMSAGLVSGAISRLRSSSLGAESEDAKEALLESAISVDALNPEYAGRLGSGLIHMGLAAAALADD